MRGTMKKILLSLIVMLILTISLNAADLKLGWDAVVPAPLGYKVYYGSASGNYTLNVDAGNLLTATVFNLTPSQRYYFVVRAYNSAGESSNSNEVHNFIVTSAAANAISATNATISWNTDSIGDSQVFYGTTVSYGLSSTLNSSLVTFHSITLSGLTPGTLYHFKVASKDALGNGVLQADYTFTTGVVPMAPQNIHIEN